MTGIIAPSILSADFKCLEKQLKEIEHAGARRIHIDVMDGVFVPNLSIGFPVIKAIRSCTDMEFDVHLMIENPERFIESAALAGADFITVHQETCRHILRIISQIKETGCKAGVALNPSTSLETLKYVIQYTDQILLMTVNPGFGGQQFITGMMKKISDCKKLFRDMGYSPLLELNGGITTENALECIQNGADILVAGSSVFQGNIKDNIKQFQQIFI
ncbi:MAG TPA: ribulose-phosphate 3-epimerase [Lachnospiraceae bacterium]|nr:ribulose-phosphate 3-epimerase [Lachnospiraceae bacterium]